MLRIPSFVSVSPVSRDRSSQVFNYKLTPWLYRITSSFCLKYFDESAIMKSFQFNLLRIYSTNTKEVGSAALRSIWGFKKRGREKIGLIRIKDHSRAKSVLLQICLCCHLSSSSSSFMQQCLGCCAGQRRVAEKLAEQLQW